MLLSPHNNWIIAYGVGIGFILPVSFGSLRYWSGQKVEVDFIEFSYTRFFIIWGLWESNATCGLHIGVYFLGF